jgi:hypothetical protein
MIEDSDAGRLTGVTLEEKWLLKYSQPVAIRFVGVWDTVGALGVPWLSLEGIGRPTFNWLETGLRLSIQNAFQALAIDEHRHAFLPTMWTKRIPKDPGEAETIAPPRALSSVEQRWFVGAHANVGGGCHSDILAQIPLKWIMGKASLHGLAFRADVDLDVEPLQAPISDSYSEFLWGLYSRFSKRFYRPLGEPPRLDARGDSHINVNETIDASVFERWRRNPSYRPPNLAAWAMRFEVDIAALDSPVMADEPHTPAPD